MLVAKKPMMDDPFESAIYAEARCPICGGPLLSVHCVARCTRCHALIDTCCEGTAPITAKTMQPTTSPTDATNKENGPTNK
jgi:hypothetical protein